MIAPTPPAARWLREVAPGPKLAALALASVALFFVTDPRAIGAAFALALGLARAACGWGLLRGLRPIGWMLGFAFVAHGLLGDWALGLAICLRIATLVLLATLVSASTEIAQMLGVADRLMRPLARLGVATRPASVAFMLALRYAPMLSGRWAMLSAAWRARSAARPAARLVAPFIVSALDDADQTAAALIARGAFRERR